MHSANIRTTMKDIKDKTCLITGGASGIGAYCVEAFLQEGAKFVAILDIAEEKGRAFEMKLSKKYPGKVLFVKCDVSDEESMAVAFNDVVDKVKQLDIVVNNAGIVNDTGNGWRTCCEINLLGAISLSLKGVNHMRKDQGGAGGTIINVSSVAAFTTMNTLPIYCATKAAVLHFSRCLSEEPFHSTTGVRVLTICINGTDTPLMLGTHERVLDPTLSQIFVNILNDSTLQRPESAAAACVAMFKNGANGSVWLSQNDAPAEDITPHIVQAYDIMTTVLK